MSARLESMDFARRLTAGQAQSIIAAGVARAETIGVPVNLAVLDDGANLVAFLRMDGAVLGSIDIALRKARTAALFQCPTGAVWDYCKPGAPAHALELSNGGLAPFDGGQPIFSANGVFVGAVGISGGAVPQDLEIAEAALLGLTP